MFPEEITDYTKQAFPKYDKHTDRQTDRPINLLSLSVMQGKTLYLYNSR